jgi:hypothetical protein
LLLLKVSTLNFYKYECKIAKENIIKIKFLEKKNNNNKRNNTIETMAHILNDPVARQLFIDCMKGLKEEDRNKIKETIKRVAPEQEQELVKIREKIEGFPFDNKEFTEAFLKLIHGLSDEDGLRIKTFTREGNPEGFEKLHNHFLNSAESKKKLCEYMTGVKPEDRLKFKALLAKVNPEAIEKLGAIKAKVTGDVFENEEFIHAFVDIVHNLPFDSHLQFIKLFKELNPTGWEKMHS